VRLRGRSLLVHHTTGGPVDGGGRGGGVAGCHQHRLRGPTVPRGGGARSRRGVVAGSGGLARADRGQVRRRGGTQLAGQSARGGRSGGASNDPRHARELGLRQGGLPPPERATKGSRRVLIAASAGGGSHLDAQGN